jgi:hypothetical protein
MNHPSFWQFGDVSYSIANSSRKLGSTLRRRRSIVARAILIFTSRTRLQAQALVCKADGTISFGKKATIDSSSGTDRAARQGCLFNCALTYGRTYDFPYLIAAKECGRRTSKVQRSERSDTTGHIASETCPDTGSGFPCQAESSAPTSGCALGFPSLRADR